jgi:hypothetical protein
MSVTKSEMDPPGLFAIAQPLEWRDVSPSIVWSAVQTMKASSHRPSNLKPYFEGTVQSSHTYLLN